MPPMIDVKNKACQRLSDATEDGAEDTKTWITSCAMGTTDVEGLLET